ncbi:MAG: hypothetical protein N4A53_12325 [Pelagimonas sp.]|jgi:hypothetical protein|nr:hypothetical protein [Pelagimonas sp.]
MIASLPMYWRPEFAQYWRGFWRDVQAVLPDLPDLTAAEDLPADWYAHWSAPDLALSHICGLPFRQHYMERCTYIGSLDFALPDTPPGYYHSLIVTRRGETRPDRDLTLAYNSADSQSGWGSTRGRHFGRHLATGAHFLSAQALVEGRADIAYIDAVTWRILQQLRPDLCDPLELHGHSTPTPGLALIAAPGRDPAPLRAALCTALDRLPDTARAAMGGPVGLCQIPMAEYAALKIPPAPPG